MHLYLRGSFRRSIYHRIGCFLRSEDQFRSFRVIKAGRRFPELFARLSEISDAVTSLGLSGEPYSRAFQGHNLPPDNSVLPELEPYRSLNPDRLVIKGRGHWDPTEFMDDSLVMAYREPSSILCDNIPEEHEIPRCNDPTAELVSLAKKWDENQLLHIHRFDVPKHQRVRIFNAWKNSQVDRQIGDRRGRNACECIVQGPSRRLPTGPDFCNLVCDPRTSSLRISVSDRKDYYHQLAVSESRAISNTVGQGIDSSLLKDTSAYSAFLISPHRKPKRDRLIVGDDLPGCRHPLLPEGQVAISFRSVLQGDHGGVEFATSAHEGLLSRFGCLTPRSRMTSEKPMFADDREQGLVIDDFYAVSVEKHGARASDSWSHGRLSRALDSYEHAALLGSPEKDLDAVDDGKVIGARLNSSKKALHQGVISVGAPLEKRLALSWITLQLVILGFSTDHLHLCLLGGWVSALLYRRPLMCILQTAFGLVDSSYSSSSPPRIIKLPHSVRDELIVLAVLAPLVLTNIGALFGSHAFATDASQDMGAIVSSPMSPQMQSLLFRVCASKGSYTRMQNARDRLLADEDFDDDGQDYFPLPQPSRPLAFVYDFIEIFAGASTVTKVMADRGWRVGPPIELSLSSEFNMEFIHVISWLSWMISVGRVLSFMVEPPCTTFSIMRRPALRSRFCPFGFNVRDRQTMVGNLLAHRALLCLYLGHRFGVPGIFENPFSSLVRHLPSWRRVSMLPFASQCRTDSCRFGSIHQKPFRFLSVHCGLEKISLRCRCSTRHVKVQGSLTKGSAVYTDLLSEGLADVLTDAILAVSQKLRRGDMISTNGLENALVNSEVKSSSWSHVASWHFKRLSHINLQEPSSVLNLVYLKSKDLRPQRIVNFVDSQVCRGAINKGRSSSRALNSILCRLAAALVASDMYLSVPFVPTRLNPADDPTRLRGIRSCSVGVTDDSWTDEDFFRLGSLPTSNRWSSNWISLVVGLVGPSVLYLSDRSLYRQCHPSIPVPYDVPNAMDFDQTLGFPGEGPNGFRYLCSVCWVCGSVWISVAPLAMSMPVGPRSSADRGRAVMRAAVPLVEGRRVLPETSRWRDSLFWSFGQWVASEGWDLEFLLANSFQNVDTINDLLVSYGHELYRSGRPYNHFAETINAVSSRRPAIRRSLQTAWNLAFGWLQQEPSQHHVAMPPQVLLGALTISLMWGWERVAGCIALSFGALLRAGEMISASRYQLLLPEDVRHTIAHGLLSILEPKTRFTAAKHQCAKIDSPDLLKVVSLAFGRLDRLQKLWPYSGQTLRTRLKTILASMKLPADRSGDYKPLDLGSLRAGGATWMLGVTENAELVRRRGRWINAKTMEIYIQEVSSVIFMSGLQQNVRDHILHLASLFPYVLEKCCDFKNAGIPCHLWYLLFKPCGKNLSK